MPRIIQLHAEAVKNLTAIDITPDGPTTVLAGNNGAGKSSVLDAIDIGLRGGAALRGIARPVRDGADKGRIIIRFDTGEHIDRTIRSDGKTTAKFVDANGRTVSGPQGAIDEMIGPFIDPLEFMAMNPKDQRARLLDLVDLGFDVDDVDRERAQLFDRRTELGRGVKALEAQVTAAGPIVPGLPAVEISMTDLAAEYKSAQDEATKRDECVRKHDEAQAKVVALDEERRALESRLAALVDERKGWAEAEFTWGQRASEWPAVDLDGITTRMATAEETNAQIRANSDRAVLEQRRAAAARDHAQVDDAIKAIDLRKTEALAAAQLPVDGLGFDDTGITYRGVPFAQCSSGERLRVAFSLAIAANPDLDFVPIRDGSLLDDEGMAAIKALADEHDVNVWIEVVGERHDRCIVIRDGEIAEDRRGVPIPDFDGSTGYMPTLPAEQQVTSIVGL